MILPEKSSEISLSCQTLRRSPSCPLFRISSTCSLCHFHIPTLSDHFSSIPASEKSASHGKFHGDTLSNHNPSVGITQIRYGRRSIFLSACHTSSRWLFSFLFFNIAHTYPVVKPPLLIALCTPAEDLLFTPFSVTPEPFLIQLNNYFGIKKLPASLLFIVKQEVYKSYFEISSIRRSSSAVNGAQWIAFTLSRICCGLEAPIRTLVTSLC